MIITSLHFCENNHVLQGLMKSDSEQHRLVLVQVQSKCVPCWGLVESDSRKEQNHLTLV